MIANEPDAEALAEWFAVKVGGYLNVASESIDIDTPLADYGLDSAFSMSLCADLQCEYGFDVDTTLVWDYPTISAIAEHLTSLHVGS
jgi:acyl carrier protein